jgi:hypothetical protein
MALKAKTDPPRPTTHPTDLAALRAPAGGLPPCPCPEPEVWVCVFARGDGIDVWVCRSEAVAYRELARSCRGYWAEAREVDRHRCHDQQNPRLPLRPPASDRASVELYFAAMRLAMPSESFTIAAHEFAEETSAGGR